MPSSVLQPGRNGRIKFQVVKIMFVLGRPVLHPPLALEELGGRQDHCPHDGPRRWGRVRGR